jgi:prepilin-type N-terminal cleavage/methylation domain-containing protein
MLLFPHICPGRKNQFKPTAFTLVELLISVAIFSVISIAVYSTFASGAKVLRKASKIDLTLQKFLLKEEKFSRELRETTACRKQLFAGKPEKLIFSGTQNELPCRITYYFDKSTQSFIREVDKLSEIIAQESEFGGELKTERSTFLKNIENARFSYYYLDLKKNKYVWEEEYKLKDLPIAVKLIITNQGKDYVTTVFLPIA